MECGHGRMATTEPGIGELLPTGMPEVGFATSPARARAFNHAGLSVLDLERSITWYREVLGLRLLMGPMTISVEDEGSEAPTDIFGPEWRKARLAHMLTPNGMGIELFEFAEPHRRKREDNFDYWLTGVTHLCFTTNDIPETLALVALHGGKARSRLHEVAPDCSFIYVEDPSGNVVELVSMTYEQLFG